MQASAKIWLKSWNIQTNILQIQSHKSISDIGKGLCSSMELLSRTIASQRQPQTLSQHQNIIHNAMIPFYQMQHINRQVTTQTGVDMMQVIKLLNYAIQKELIFHYFTEKSVSNMLFSYPFLFLFSIIWWSKDYIQPIYNYLYLQYWKKHNINIIF